MFGKESWRRWVLTDFWKKEEGQIWTGKIEISSKLNKMTDGEGYKGYQVCSLGSWRMTSLLVQGRLQLRLILSMASGVLGRSAKLSCTFPLMNGALTSEPWQLAAVEAAPECPVPVTEFIALHCTSVSPCRHRMSIVLNIGDLQRR